MQLTNKNVLVTGSDGFIGSHLVEALISENCKVKAFVHYNSFNSWGWLDTFPKEKLSDLEIFPGDVRDPHGVSAAVKGADVVFHLAALIGIPFSYLSPDSYVDTNIKGTLNILLACRELDVERVVVTSTSEVYGTADYIPIDENHPLKGQSPYSASKIGADKIAESFNRSFETPVTIARLFNAYGPRQSARAVIPTIITQIVSGEKKIKLGDLTPTRDFTYVIDLCKGMIALAKNENAVGETVNIGSNREISVKDLLLLIKTIMDSDIEYVTEEKRIRPRNSEVFRLLCDNTKLKKLTGFEPENTIEDGLTKTVSWFSNPKNLAKYKTNIYNV